MTRMISPKPRGVILLVTLLTFAVITGAAIAGAAIVLRGMRSVSGTERIIRAEYVAEGGIEDALFHLRRGSGALPAGHGTITYTTGEKSVQTVLYGEEEYTTDLALGAVKEFGLYDPVTGEGGDVEALAFAWADSCGGGSSLEIKWVSDWVIGASVDWFAKGVNSQTWSQSFSPVAITDFVNGGSYRVRVASVDCALDDLTISAYRDDGLLSPASTMQTRTRALTNATVDGYRADKEEFTVPFDELPLP